MVERLPRPTTNHYAGDPRPDLTERAILAKLAEIGRPSNRRELCTLVYGTDKAGASRIAGALGGLRTKRLVDDAHGGKYRPVRINAAGLAALALADTLDEADLPPCETVDA